MNIIFLCRLFHQFRGGLESYTYEMARALAARGHAVHIICEDKGDFYRHTLEDGIHVHAIAYNENPFPGSWKINSIIPLHDILYSRKAAEKIHALIKTTGIDIVEAPDVQEQGFWYAWNKRTPFFLRLHGWFFMRKFSTLEKPRQRLSLRKAILKKMQRNSILKADGVATVSSDFAGFIREFWNLKNNPIDVIHNAVDTSLFHAADGQRELSVLFVGRMEHKKGIRVLARAIPAVLREFPNVKFYFAGRNTRLDSGSETAYEYILKYAPKDSVVFLGELATQALIPYYQKIAIGVFPSLYEPFGIVALESMACGCATIASRVGGLMDIIDHERDGLLVQPGDHEELSIAIIRFFKEESLRKNCSINAIKKVKEQFTMDKLVDHTLAAYQRAVETFHHSFV